jgi:methionyl-tRNA formyltransferase
MRQLQSGIKLQAMEMGLPIFQPERIRTDEAQARVHEVGADLMVVVAYGQILPASLLNAPRLGTLNVHASLLPRHRGAAPIEWSILSGDTETGVTIMQMDAGVDTGPILAQVPVPLAVDATAGPLEGQLANLGARLMARTLDDFANGRITPVPQPAEGATYAPRLTSQDGKLDPATMSAHEIDRRVRALSERLGCWITLNSAEMKVIRGHLDSAAGEGIPVSTADGIYVVDEVQPPGGRRMTAAAWARGRR